MITEAYFSRFWEGKALNNSHVIWQWCTIETWVGPLDDFKCSGVRPEDANINLSERT